MPLTRPHRQVLATLALLLFTVAPTAFVAWMSWRVNQPGHVREVERELGRRLGLRVALQGVRYPSPGEVILRGVMLEGEEARGKATSEVARAETVRARREGRALRLEATGLQLRGEGPRQALAQATALFGRAGAGDFEFDRISLAAPSCAIDLGAPRYAFRELAATFQADARTPTMTASYRVAGDGASTRCEVILTRDRGGDAARTTLAFKTMEGPPLPAAVLDPFFDTAGWLGPRATLWGALTLTQAGAADWEAEFRGDLIDVDLGTLVGRRFPDQRLTGLALVAIESARWGDRGAQGVGWAEASGALSAKVGSIGVGLLGALHSEMNFGLRPKVAALVGRPGRDLEYLGLGLSFAMTPDGELRLGALRSEYGPDVVLVEKESATALALAPKGAANVRGLWKALFPVGPARADLMVPATAQTQTLMHYLPLPPAEGARPVRGN